MDYLSSRLNSSGYLWPSDTVKSPGFFKPGSCFSFFLKLLSFSCVKNRFLMTCIHHKGTLPGLCIQIEDCGANALMFLGPIILLKPHCKQFCCGKGLTLWKVWTGLLYWGNSFLAKTGNTKYTIPVTFKTQIIDCEHVSFYTSAIKLILKVSMSNSVQRTMCCRRHHNHQYSIRRKICSMENHST